MLAIAISAAPIFVRLARGMAMEAKATEWVEAARALGNPPWRTAVVHVLPNIVPPLLVQASFVFAFAQLGAASLDFLGLGQKGQAAVAKFLALGRRGDAAGGAVHQADAEPLLHVAQALAEARDRDAALQRGAPEVAGACHRHEGVEVAKVEILHCSI